MMPSRSQHSHPFTLGRRAFLGLGIGLAAFAGCTKTLTRGQTPEELDLAGEEEKKLDLVGNYTRPWGLNLVKLESVGLVTNLAGTGSDPPPSPQRQMLINEMQSHSVDQPEKWLASENTSMVIVRGYLPPGVKEGDMFDVEIRIPSGSETTSLRNGWLLRSRMRQVEILGGSLHTGSVEALVEGDVLVDSIFDGDSDKIDEVRGRVLGRAVAQRSRELGLAIRQQDASYRIVTLITKAINARFHTFENNSKRGVAIAKRPNFLELAVPPNYKHNLDHYLVVVRNIPLRENPVERLDRVSLLEKKILEPTTAGAAAIQLEAIGKDGASALQRGLSSSDGEVRFYAAESLAYLNDEQNSSAAAPILREVARDDANFRWHALTALASMDDTSAYEALSDLLHVPSAETRYGAFRAIRTRNPDDPNTKGEFLGYAATPEDAPKGGFRYHLVSTTGEPLIHFSRSKRPELVVFGHEQRLKVPETILVGNMSIKGMDGDQIRICKFAPGDGGDKVEVCSSELDKVIRTMVRVGGGYSEVLQAILEAKKLGLIQARVAIEAMPQPSRRYYKDAEDSAAEASPEEESSQQEAANDSSVADDTAGPAPEIFRDPLNSGKAEKRAPTPLTDTYVDPTYQEQKKGFFDKINPWKKEQAD